MGQMGQLQRVSEPLDYLAGWAGLSRLMDQGVSWSGHERNCVFRNRGGGDFAEVSALSGLDFDDDGRACIATDLDADGDIDLVLKNRSAPQLRFVRNDSGGARALLLRLCDPTSRNRDAIGARVELMAGDRRLVRTVTAGDGYLGQQSRWLHFGSDGVPPRERLAVRWPDGESEEFTKPEGPGRFVAVRGAGKLEARPAAPTNPPADERPLPPLSTTPAVLLREPLFLPPTLARVAFRGKPQRPVLLSLWSRSCEVCSEEIRNLAAGHAELQRVGVDVVFLGLHESAAQAEAALTFRDLTVGLPAGAVAILRQRPASDGARHAFAALLEATLGRAELTAPTSFLIDADARIQVVYPGTVTAEVLAADTARFGLAKLPGPLRTTRGGRWVFAVERSLPPIIRGLALRGLDRDAAFFAQLAAERRRLREPPK